MSESKTPNRPQSSPSSASAAANASRRKVLRVGVIPNRQTARIDDEQVIKANAEVTIGRDARNTFAFPAAKLPDTFILFQYDKGASKYALRFSEKMEGKIAAREKDGASKDITLSESKKNGKAAKKGEIYELALEETWRGTIQLGEITILFSFVPEPVPVKAGALPREAQRGFFEQLDRTFLAIFAISFAIHSAIAIPAFIREIPEAEPEFSDEEVVGMLIQTPPQVQPAPEPPKDEGPAAVDEGPKDDSPAAPAPKPVEEPSGGRPGEAGDPKAVADKVGRVGALAAIGRLSANGGAMADLYNDGSGGAEAALDGLTPAGGAALATAGTDLGAGLRPGDGGGGGDGSGTIAGLNASETGAKGVNTAANPSAKGPEKTIKAVVKSSGTDVTEGEGGVLDGRAIADVIRRYQGPIQACYERALGEQEGLQGRLRVSFTISEKGRVVAQSAVEDTVGSSAVTSCVLGVISRLKFPENGEGSGNVTASSTFVFTKTN